MDCSHQLFGLLPVCPHCKYQETSLWWELMHSSLAPGSMSRSCTKILWLLYLYHLKAVFYIGTTPPIVKPMRLAQVCCVFCEAKNTSYLKRVHLPIRLDLDFTLLSPAHRPKLKPHPYSLARHDLSKSTRYWLLLKSTGSESPSVPSLCRALSHDSAPILLLQPKSASCSKAWPCAYHLG